MRPARLSTALAMFALGCAESGGPIVVPPAGEWTTRRVAGQPNVAGLGGDAIPADESPLYWPVDVAFGPAGEPYVMDWNNHRVRVIGSDGLVETPIARTFTGGEDAWLIRPTTATFAPDGRMVLVAADEVRRVDLVTGDDALFCTDFGECDLPPLQPTGVAFDARGRMYVADVLRARIVRLDEDGVARPVVGTGIPGFNGDGPARQTQIFREYDGLRVDLGARITMGGDGLLYFADTGNNRIRAFDPETDTVTTVVGSGYPGFDGDGGPALDAEISRPPDVAWAPGGTLYFPDWRHNCVRASVDGIVGTVAGTCENTGTGGLLIDLEAEQVPDTGDPLDMQLFGPFGVEVAPDGAIWVADTDRQVIRVLVPPGAE